MGKLSPHLGASQFIDVKMMGPSGHTAYLANVLKVGLGMRTRHVSADNDLTAQSSREDVREGAIAIIGVADKGPDGENLDDFWKVIETGKDCHQEIPADRFPLNEFYCPRHVAARLGDIKCTLSCRHGCFMKNPVYFDSEFFHISPRKSLLMDPFVRLFLMSAYEALERAGYS